MNWLWKSQIAKKLLGSFLTVIIPIMSISLIVNYMSMNIIRSEVYASYKNSVSMLSEQFSNSLDKFSLIAKNLSIDTDITAVDQSPADLETLFEYTELLKKIKKYSATNDMSANIMIYMKYKNMLLSSTLGIDGMSNPDFLNEYRSYSDMRWWVKDGRIVNNQMESKQKVLVNVQGIIGSKLSDNLVSVIEIPVSDIRRVLASLRVKEGGTAFLFGPDGFVISANQQEMITYENIYKEVLRSEDTVRQFTYAEGAQKYQIIYHHLGNSGLVLGMYFPESQILAPILKVSYLIVIVLLASILLAAFFTYVSYRDLLLPVHKLVNAMKQLRNGDLATRLPEEESSELGFMVNQFNKMAEQIDSLFNQVYMEKLKAQQAQLKFLQSQINPHFLYNCLYFIYDMSKAENNEIAANMAMYLGEYFRYATRSNMDMVTLREEIESIHSYINIQKMRYSDKITFWVDVAEHLKDTRIPRLIIQPLIENAIIHGMESTKRKGNIWLNIQQNSGDILICVEDDGAGIPGEKLKEILNELDDMDKKTKSYGLSNTHWRLKLRYGGSAGVWIENREPQGTRVTAVIPGQEEAIMNV